MDHNEIIEEMMNGRHCAQIVLSAFADETGYDEEETDALAKFFDGGMNMGQTCGAVTGALMVMGLLKMSKGQAMEFEIKFKERFGSCVCYDLLDKKQPGQANLDGTMLEKCPAYIEAAINMIQEKLDE